MAMERNPFETLKNLPYMNEEVLKELTNMKWPWQGSADILSAFSQRKWPPITITETATELIVTLAIPGLQKPSDVKVELSGNTLNIRGKSAPAIQSSPVFKVHQQELHEGEFNRNIDLPIPVSSKGARANYQQGILEIKFMKSVGAQTETLTINFYR